MARAPKPKQFPTHGPELRALLIACHANPDDDTTRLVLADWLQEHDDPRGELVRLQVRIAALPAGDPEYDALFEQHRKWWKDYGKLWEKECSGAIWDSGPHDRGLPTLGNYDYDYDDCWLTTGDLEDPTENPKAYTSATIATGWPGMTWVFVEDPLVDEYGDGLDEDEDAPAVHASVAEALAFEPFDQPPWAGSPTPIGVAFPDTMLVTPEIIDRVAKVPNVRGLSLTDVQPTPDLLPRIAKIKRLEHLDLDELRLTDDGLRTLAPLKRLRTLICANDTITNEGAKVLAKFRELRELRLDTRRLTGAGFQTLAQLTKLEVLKLAKADDAAIRHLSGLKRLRKLELAGTKVTGRGLENFPLLTDLEVPTTQLDDAGMASIAALPRLHFLNIYGTQITGSALHRLSGLRRLERLFADNTGIRDKDLVHLEPLKNLALLILWGTRVTNKGRVALQKKLKRTTIHR